MTITADPVSGALVPDARAPLAAQSAAEALTAVVAAVDLLLAADLNLPADTDIVLLLRGIETQTRRLHTASLAVITQTVQRALAAPAGATTTANFVRQLLPITAADAAARVRLAAAVTPTTGLTGTPLPPVLPLLAAALDTGTIGAAQAGTIVTTLNGFPADVPPDVRHSVEAFLIEQGAVLDPKTLHNVARRIALMANPDGPYDERDAADKQQFHIGARRDDGLTRCWGLLDDITVETLRTALAALCSPKAARDSAGHPNASTGTETETETGTDPRPSTGPGSDLETGSSAGQPADADEGEPATEPTEPPDEALIPSDGVPASRPPWRPSRPPFDWAPLGTLPSDYPARPTSSNTQSANDATPPATPPADDAPSDRRPAATRRAHALAAILTAYLNSGAAPILHGEKPHLLVTLTETDLRRATGSAQLGYGDTIDITTARMLACDAAVIPAVLRGPTDIIDIGRAMRTFTAAGRKAILLRDIGCVFPGCTMPGTLCDNHHIQHWANGGPSNLDNAALLCRRHHTLIHHGAWQVRLAADRTPEILPPASHDPTRQPLRNAVHRPPQFQWPARSSAAHT